MVAALILDLKDSKKYKISKRNAVQDYLIEISGIINDLFHDGLLRDLSFTGGDEIQGLFNYPEIAFLCLRLFQRALHDTPFHAGIGLGEWSTVVENKNTFYQDGTAYHRARRAIDLSKKEKEYTAVICSETKQDPVLNSMLNACFQLMPKRKDTQKSLILLLEYCYPLQIDMQMNTKIFEKLLLTIAKGYSDSQELSLLETYIQTAKKIGITPLDEKDSIIDDTKQTASNHSLVFQDSHPFGAAKKLANITGTSRQNVDKALYTANSYVERSIALALLYELSEIRYI